MRKILAMILGMCLLLSTLCVTVFAADAPTAAVLRISGEKKDGKLVHIQDYTVFDDGWNAAMELAINSKELNKKEYTRVVVDLLADWEASNGEFTDDTWNGKGFNWDAIYFYDEARITLNLNGHTINRGLTSYQYNGEVMYIDEDADVIINGGKIGDPIIAPGEDPGNVQMGTITGGFSCNGAGGIHINDGANVTLNNVCLIGNTVEDDKGSAIAIYDDAELTMNGGCMSNNSFAKVENVSQMLCYSAHVNGDYSFAFTECTFNNNKGPWSDYAFDGYSEVPVTLTDCDLGNSNFTANAKKYFKFDGYSATLTLGSLFGDGSLSMVVAILALAASIAAIGVSISSNKKIVSAKSGEAREDEE